MRLSALRASWPLVLAAVVTGLGHPLISPPLGWIGIHPLLWVPLLLAVRGRSPGQALAIGWLAGFTAQASVFHWVIHTVTAFTNVPAAAAALILVAFALFWGFYAGIFGWGYAAVRRASGSLWPAGVAAFFVACEALNPQLFPYFQGVVWFQQPWIFGSVAWMSFLVMLANTTLAQLVEHRWSTGSWRGAPRAAAALWSALVVASVGLSQWQDRRVDAAQAAAEPMRVALVQTNRDVFEMRAMERAGRSGVVEDLVALAREAWARDPGIDAFVFPEGALRGDPRSKANRAAIALAQQTGAELWSGGSGGERRGDRVDYYNSAWRIHDGGKAIGPRYDKRILLPFGEFMPFVQWLPFLRRIQGPGAYQPGDGLLVHDGPARVSFLICYEAIRHRYVRHVAELGTTLLVNVTYDAWYGRTTEQDQHLMLSVIQSALYGVPMVRATTTGISAVSDARGRILARTGNWTRDVLVADVRPVHVPTVVGRVGDWFVWFCTLLGGALLVRGRPDGRRRLWIGVGLATLLSPINSLANPYLQPMEWCVWLYALATLGIARWRSRAR